MSNFTSCNFLLRDDGRAFKSLLVFWLELCLLIILTLNCFFQKIGLKHMGLNFMEDIQNFYLYFQLSCKIYKQLMNTIFTTLSKSIRSGLDTHLGLELFVRNICAVYFFSYDLVSYLVSSLILKFASIKKKKHDKAVKLFHLLLVITCEFTPRLLKTNLIGCIYSRRPLKRW